MASWHPSGSEPIWRHCIASRANLIIVKYGKFSVPDPTILRSRRISAMSRVKSGAESVLNEINRRRMWRNSQIST